MLLLTSFPQGQSPAVVRVTPGGFHSSWCLFIIKLPVWLLVPQGTVLLEQWLVLGANLPGSASHWPSQTPAGAARRVIPQRPQSFRLQGGVGAGMGHSRPREVHNLDLPNWDAVQRHTVIRESRLRFTVLLLLFQFH